MPGFTINTPIKGNANEVFARFDEALFNYLKPPSFIAEIKRYEGNKIGDKVAVAFKFPWQSLMVVEITEISEKEGHFYFVDEGRKLPFGITHWNHTHHVIANGNCSIIKDEIQFKTRFLLTMLFIWPAFYVSFLLRKPQYKKYFGSCQ